jgi:hypothetical protein
MNLRLLRLFLFGLALFLGVRLAVRGIGTQQFSFVPKAHAGTLTQQFGFEPRAHILGKGSDPQLAVRASGEVFLLTLRGKDLWVQTSFDNADSFDSGVQVNDTGAVMSHSENTPQMVVRSMHEFYVLWAGDDGHDHVSIRLARSMDWGKSFGKSIAVDPASPSSQGFYTMAIAPDGTIFVAWLDGRDREQGKPGTSAVYVARSTNRGQSFEKAVRVALNVCPCCRPALAFSDAKTVHVGWRGVYQDDIRDFFVATSRDGGTSFGFASRVAVDNWHINGCPHSGPALATLGGRLFVSWHTVVGDRSHLYLAWSDDGGTHFSPKIEADTNLLDANHPRLVNLNNSLALVFQARKASPQNGWGKLDVYFRQVDKSGSLSPLQPLGHVAGSATYPALLFEDPDHLFVAWTERNDDGPAVVLSRGRPSLLKGASSSGSSAKGKLRTTSIRSQQDGALK